MTLDRPKNNIHSHITWFNAQKPQIPRPSTEQRKDYTQNSAIIGNLLDSATARTVATDIVPPIHAPMSFAQGEALNNPTNIRDTPTAAAKFLELKTPGQSIPIPSSELPSIARDGSGRGHLNGAKKEMVGNGTEVCSHSAKSARCPDSADNFNALRSFYSRYHQPCL